MSEWDNGFARAQAMYEAQMPPEPPECCELWEDPGHDNEQCMADQREAAAEAKAEQARDEMKAAGVTENDEQIRWW